MDNQGTSGGGSGSGVQGFVHVSLKERLKEADEFRRTGKPIPQRQIQQQPQFYQQQDIIINNYKIIGHQFCNLAKEIKFNNWLQKINLELYTEFSKNIVISTSCSANANTMHKVLQNLTTNNLGNELIEFLKKEYPSVLKEI